MNKTDLSKEILKVDAYHINSVVIVIRRADGTMEKCLVNTGDIIKADVIITGPASCNENNIASPIPTLVALEGKVISIIDKKMRLDCSKEYEHDEKVIYIANIRTIDNITNPQKPIEPPKEEDTTPEGEIKPPDTGDTKPSDNIISSEDGTPILIIK